ncbi:MAG TPA: hypothetical protein VH087_13000 [Thermoanaerobaculia bacterium]|nr:hypothetical protein [Thermoanaerobaculia bacterium]
MATRTVRLDDEAERALKEVQATTGLPISEVLKRGLHAIRDEVTRTAAQTPWDIYQVLDIGPGGYSRFTSTNAKRDVRAALKKKLGR